MMAWRGALGALALSLMSLSGCSATAQVAVDARANGTGTVTVTVTLDKAATESIGDVAAQLDTSDLVHTGWTVTGPVEEPDGSTVVSVAKPFATLVQASAIVEQIAGSGPPASRPFQLSIVRHRTFWKTTTTLSGDVDLRCGLDCFGDPGLQKALGSPTGINPATGGSDPDRLFHFALSVELPGTVHDSNAELRRGAVLQWTPTLGSALPLAAVSESVDTAHLDEAAGAAGLVGVVLLGLVLALVIRRRHRRRRGNHFPTS